MFQLLQQLLNLTSLQVLANPSQEEVFFLTVLQVLNVCVLNIEVCLEDEDLLADGTGKYLSESIDKSSGGYSHETNPPKPEDEEVVLVEEIVGEYAESIFYVSVTIRAAVFDIAGDFRGEQVTLLVDLALLMVEDFCSIFPEFVIEESVHNEETQN